MSADKYPSIFSRQMIQALGQRRQSKKWAWDERGLENECLLSQRAYVSQSIEREKKLLHRGSLTPRERGGGVVLPLYMRLYRYVQVRRVWFFSRFGHKKDIDFS